jgi:pimeloyl-ACP methyl ester carboxylesterase
MKRWLLAMVLLVACARPAAAPEVAAQAAQPTASDIVGPWSGDIETPMGDLPVVLRISRQGEVLSSTLDSPSQGSEGIPGGATTFADGRLVVEVPVIRGRYEAAVEGDRMVGTWTQSGQSMPLVLTRGESLLARPQTPQPPFPYTIEEVAIPSAPGVTLAGTLTTPEGAGPFTAVVLVSGSGPQDRDETIGTHKPFWVIADHLSRAGVAVLRYDDRGFGKSTGDFAAATLPDFAVDAAAAMAWLDARSETGAVGYVGHSEGAYAAPIAHQRQRADFVVLLAGPAVAGDQVLLAQGRLIMEASGATADEVATQQSMTVAVLDLVRSDEPAATLGPKVVEALEVGGDLPEEVIPGLVQTYTSEWFRGFVRYDPEADLGALDVPTLALWGSNDLQVPPSQSAEPMARLLGEHGTVEVLDGLNHLFQPSPTGAIADYGQIETTVDPALLDRLTSWLLARTAR